MGRYIEILLYNASMNKDKYKNNYITVIRAIQHALEQYSWDDHTRLFISKENGLENINLLEVKDILNSLKNENVLEVTSDIKISDFNLDRTPMTSVAEYAGSRKRKVLQNHFILKVDKIRFKNLLSKYGSPLQLLSLIPDGKKYKNQRIITQLLVEKGKVENYEIATKIKIIENHSKLKLTKKDYFRNKEKISDYNEKIENCLKTLRAILLPYGYKVKFNQQYTELINIQL